MASFPLDRRGERGRILDRDGLNAARDAFGEPGEHLAGRAFDDASDPLAREELHRLDPAHRMVELVDEGAANLLRFAERLGETVLHDRHDRLAELHAPPTLAQAL